MIEMSKLVNPSSNQTPTPVEPTRETLKTADENNKPPVKNQEVERANKQQEAKKGREVTKEDAQEWTGFVNDFLTSVNISMRFQVYDKSDKWFVQLINDESGEVVRQIPSKEMLQMAARIKEMMDQLMSQGDPVGVLLDSKG